MAAPHQPVQVIAIQYDGNSIQIAATCADTVIYWKLKKSFTPGGPYTTVGCGDSCVFLDYQVSFNKTYYYYVVSAVNKDGESPNSVEVSCMTMPLNTM